MEKKEKQIFDFLKKQKDYINLSRLAIALNVSYTTIQKYCHVLAAKGEVQIEDYGNVKLVKFKEGK